MLGNNRLIAVASENNKAKKVSVIPDMESTEENIFILNKVDSLWNITQQKYGEGEKRADIFKFNKNSNADHNLINPRQKLKKYDIRINTNQEYDDIEKWVVDDNIRKIKAKLPPEVAVNYRRARLWTWQDLSSEEDYEGWDSCICVTDDIWFDEKNDTVYAKIPETMYVIESEVGEYKIGTFFECGRDEYGIEYYIANYFCGSMESGKSIEGFADVHFKVNENHPDGYLTDFKVVEDYIRISGDALKDDNDLSEDSLEILEPYNFRRYIKEDDGTLLDDWVMTGIIRYKAIDVSDGFHIKAIPMEEAIDGYNPLYTLCVYDMEDNEYIYKAYE